MSHARPKKIRTRCLSGFSVMWVTKLLIFPVKKRIFCPKTTKFGHKIGIFGQFGPGQAGFFLALLWVGWWLWRAGCITYLLYSRIILGKKSVSVHCYCMMYSFLSFSYALSIFLLHCFLICSIIFYLIVLSFTEQVILEMYDRARLRKGGRYI